MDASDYDLNEKLLPKSSQSQENKKLSQEMKINQLQDLVLKIETENEKIKKSLNEYHLLKKEINQEIKLTLNSINTSLEVFMRCYLDNEDVEIKSEDEFLSKRKVIFVKLHNEISFNLKILDGQFEKTAFDENNKKTIGNIEEINRQMSEIVRKNEFGSGIRKRKNEKSHFFAIFSISILVVGYLIMIYIYYKSFMIDVLHN
jgi:hypothetical protein